MVGMELNYPVQDGERKLNELEPSLKLSYSTLLDLTTLAKRTASILFGWSFLLIEPSGRELNSL